MEFSPSTSNQTITLFGSVISALTRSLKGPAQDAAIAALAKLQGYDSYLEETNERVSTFKSFANPRHPVSLLDHFTKVILSQRQSETTIEHTDIIEQLRARSRIIISATAGYGKSMLLRYAALCMYNNPMGRLPIFIELRHLNRMQTPDLLSYIHSSYNKNSKVQKKDFDQNLTNGVFCFILDGFDELNHDIRSDIESQILNLSKKHPKNSFILSGRPDDRFEAWRSFALYRIEPMAKDQVIELFNKLDFDEGTKKRFINKINRDDLYGSHSSFLSTPLLAILMLLTFEENANIPDKMHLFYAKAFETLFHKHDALKEQYDRQRRSSILIDEFAKIFSVFCLNTYILEKVEFNHIELLKFIKSAVEYENSSVKHDDFLFDLVESVCLLQKEGLSYFFVHRSFQEYFTAMFLANCPEDVRDMFIDQVCTRYWDNVLPMLYDMASHQLEPSWITKNCDQFLSEVGYEDGKIPPALALFPKLIFHERGGRRVLFHTASPVYGKFLNTITRFYRDRFDKAEEYADYEMMMKLADELPGFRDASEKAGFGDTVFGKDGKVIEVETKQESLEWLSQVGLKKFAESRFDIILDIRRNLKEELKEKQLFLSALFER